MFGRLVVCLLLAGCAAYPDLFLRNVTVVNVADGAVIQNRSILIHGGKIAAVGIGITPTSGAQIVEGTGKFVIPGLWDMHVHLTSKEQLSMYTQYGITGVRDMGSDFETVQQWRDAIQRGTLNGPRILTSGAAFDGFPANDPKIPVRVVRDPNQARGIFDRADDEGIDFVSVLPRLPRDAYFALAERARKYYSFVTGPVPSTVSVLEAIDARQKTIDRMAAIVLACSTEETKLRPMLALALERRDGSGIRDAEMAAANSFDREKAKVLFERMALYDTRSVPMLVTQRFAPAADIHGTLSLMHQAGVGVLAGTDSGQGGGRPGETLHTELELLVSAGFTPAEALRTATLEPAKYLDDTESFGAIEAGKAADLVLLSANPLLDIRNTRKIVGVVLNGKYQPR